MYSIRQTDVIGIEITMGYKQTSIIVSREFVIQNDIRIILSVRWNKKGFSHYGDNTEVAFV